MTARFIRAVVVSLLSCSSLRTLTLPAAWQRVSSVSIYLAHSRVHAARDLHGLSSSRASVSVCHHGRGQGCSTPIYRPTLHTRYCACGMAAGFIYSIWLDPARNRNESSARYVCSARVNLSCWQAKKDHERVDWLAFETRHERDMCVLLGSSSLAHVRSVLSAVSSVRDPVVKR